jgi:hypothetical protein
MNDAKAIECLEYLIGQLNSITVKTSDAWQTQASSYIKTFFGSDAPEYYFVTKTLSFHSMYSDMQESAMRAAIPEAEYFLRNCIKKIEDAGIYKPPKPNLLFYMDNKWIIGAIISLLSAAFFFGKGIGQRNADVANMELKIEINKLKDSLRRLPTSLDITEKVLSKDTGRNQSNFK